MIHIIALAVINAASASIFAIITLLVSISPYYLSGLASGQLLDKYDDALQKLKEYSEKDSQPQRIRY